MQIVQGEIQHRRPEERSAAQSLRVAANRRIGWRGILASALMLSTTTLSAQDAVKFEVHEWSVWVGESQGKGLNSLADYQSAMPGIVETDRSRRRENAKPGPTPMSLMALYGDPPEFVDVDLRINSGRPVAQWPRSEGKSNRLRWLDLKVAKEPDDPSKLVPAPEGHWFLQARNLGGLYIHMKSSARIERFFTYDFELQTPLTMRVDGGADLYKIVNLGKHPLKDVLLIVPTPDGKRVGWLDDVAGAPAANPAQQPQPQPQGGNPAQPPKPPELVVDCPLSDVLKPDSDEYRQRTTDELKKRLVAAGMTEAEIDLMLSLHSQSFFGHDEVQVVYRLSNEALDEISPLTVEPETAKVKRAALIIGRSLDPRLREDIDKLIAELGDAQFSKREQAEIRLRGLGRLAIPKLKEVLKNPDLEVVVRAERLLLDQKEQLPQESQ